MASPIDTKFVTPLRIVIDPIRWVRDHQVRLDTAEHALDVRGDGAVAAEETVPAEQPQIARLGDRVLGQRRRVVGIGQAFGLVRQERGEFEFAEAGERKIKAELAEIL